MRWAPTSAPPGEGGAGQTHEKCRVARVVPADHRFQGGEGGAGGATPRPGRSPGCRRWSSSRGRSERVRHRRAAVPRTHRRRGQAAGSIRPPRPAQCRPAVVGAPRRQGVRLVRGRLGAGGRRQRALGFAEQPEALCGLTQRGDRPREILAVGLADPPVGDPGVVRDLLDDGGGRYPAAVSLTPVATASSTARHGRPHLRRAPQHAADGGRRARQGLSRHPPRKAVSAATRGV